jgi:hypothetical protein
MINYVLINGSFREERINTDVGIRSETFGVMP